MTLTAGRSLDALVAEHVMGLTVAHDMTVGPYVRYHPDDDPLRLAEVPHYSTNIAAAWRVVDHMGDRGWWLEVHRRPKEYSTDYWVEAYRNDSGPAHRKKIFCHDSAPFAICLAALKAVGYEVEGGSSNG